METVINFVLAMIPAAVLCALLAIAEGLIITFWGDDLPSWVGDYDSPYDLDHGHYTENGWFSGYADTEEEDDEDDNDKYWDVCSAPITRKH